MNYRKPLRYNKRMALMKELKELGVVFSQFIGVLAVGIVALLAWWLLSVFILV